MKNLLITLVIMVSVSGCAKKIDSLDPTYNNLEFTILCLDGVQYWAHIANSSNSFGLMSPKIDPLTLRPNRCTE